MNNMMIKSLRHTLACTIAAAAVSVGFMACSDETFMMQDTTAPADGYKVSIQASIGSGDTRAIDYNSETGGYDATFETSDKIYVYNSTKDANAQDENYLQPDADGKNAHLKGSLTFYGYDDDNNRVRITPSVGDELVLMYNSSSFSYDNMSGGGVKDFAEAKVTITSISNGAITTTPATFRNSQSIFKINFTGLDNSVKIKSVVISSQNKKLCRSYYPDDQRNYYGNVSYTYADGGTADHEQTFMLRFDNNPSDVVNFLILGSDGKLYKGSKPVSNGLANSRYYEAEVEMTYFGEAMKLTNTTTGQAVEVTNYVVTLNSKEAAYTLENIGEGYSFYWNGGNNTFTLKNVSLSNESTIFAIQPDYKDRDNTKEHKLKLEGENTMISNASPFRISNDCSLVITAAENSKLNVEGNGGIFLNSNSTLVLQSGEVSVSDQIDLGSNNPILKIEGGILTSNEIKISPNMTSSCVISGSGKFRVLTSKVNFPKEIIKPALGHILKETQEGNYTVWSVTEAPYEEPKNLSAASASDIGKIIGSDGKVYMPLWVPENVTPIGMIASITSTGHGLATAMKEVEAIRSEGNTSWGVSRFSWDASGRDNAGKTATEIFNEWKVNHNVNFGTWRIPSKDDFSTIILGCKTNGDATEANDHGMIANGLYQKFVDAGTLNPNGDLSCWTSTEDTFVQDNITYNNMRAMSLKKEDNDYKAYLNLSISRSSEGYCILPVLEFSAN